MFMFSLNFEMMNLFNLDIDFLASKITIVLLFLISIINYKKNFNIKCNKYYTYPLVLYFIFFTIVNYYNRNVSISSFFDTPFFLNIVIFIILTNVARIDSRVLLIGLYWFAFGSIILALLFYLNINISDNGHEGRVTIFGMNQNHLGVILALSIFILCYKVLEKNRPFLGSKGVLLITIPFLFIFLISTGSRTAFISLFLALLVVLFLNKKITNKRRYIYIFSTTLLFIIVWLVYLKDSLVIERLGSTFGEGDLSSRDLIWITLFDIVMNNIWIGIGKSGYGIHIVRLTGDVVSPHNVILETIVYTGLTGLIIFSTFLFRITRTAFHNLKSNNNILPLILLIPIMGNLLSGQIFEVKIPWIIFAYIVGSQHPQKLYK